MLFATPSVIQADNILWYDKPATFWTEALPLGNGRLGAMVYGGVRSDTIQINESSFWAGCPYRKADAGNQGMPYEAVGNLILSFPTHNSPSGYRRELNIADATAHTTYTAGGVTYDRTVITSFADDVILIHIRASKKGALNFTADIAAPQNRERILCNVNRTEGLQDELRVYSYHAQPDVDGIANGLHCTSIVKAQCIDGKCSASGNKLTITDASEALIVISSATNYIDCGNITADSELKARMLMSKFSAKGNVLQKFSVVENDHKNLYHKQFDRVKLNIGGSMATDNQTTDRRIMSMAYADDSRLLTDLFQYGRYLLICSSQKGGLPANSQGLWNPDSGKFPYDDSNYDLSSTLPMTYWPAEIANLTESNQAYLQFIKQLSEKGTKRASDLGMRGWSTARHSDLWCGNGDGADDGVAYNAWLSTVLWDSYLYSGDRSFLSTVAFPIMAEASRNYLGRDLKEIGRIGMNNQLLSDLFFCTRQAAETIASSMWGKAAANLTAFADSLDDARTLLPPMAIDSDGMLASSADMQQLPAIANLWCAYPGRLVSPYVHPELSSAIRSTLINMGDGGNSEALAWKACLWTRMLDGDHAYRMLLNAMSIKDPNEDNTFGHMGGLYPDMVCGNPEFSIAGNAGCVAAMSEMLVQSHAGAVHLLPALPSAWANGEVSGLRCRGGFEIVKMKWNNGMVQSVTIRSTVGGTLRLRTKAPLRLASGRELAVATYGPSNNNLLRQTEFAKPLVCDPSKLIHQELEDTNVYDIQTNPGTEYTFVR